MFTRCVFAFDAVVQRTPADAWTRPSPCARWTARHVVAHNVIICDMVTDATHGHTPVVPSLADDPRPSPGVSGYVWSDAMLAQWQSRPIPPDQNPIAVWNTHRHRVLEALDSRVASKLEGQNINLVTSAIDKLDATEKSATEPQPARQAKARTKQKAATPQSYNPFASIFGN